MKRKKNETSTTDSSPSAKRPTPVQAQDASGQNVSKPETASSTRQAIMSQISAAVRAGAPIMAAIRTFSACPEFDLSPADKQSLITAACQARVRFILEAAKQEPLAWLKLVEPTIASEIEWLEGKSTGEKLLMSPIFMELVNSFRPTLETELGEEVAAKIVAKICDRLEKLACMHPSSSLIKEKEGSMYATNFPGNSNQSNTEANYHAESL